ncbi:hypothetical protein BDF19DRAFT_419500 [Syncephalis fuscata]|nr:hypothetical protein BDF19DRAFT_419500 [Syncephalis fuscata]
MTVTTTIGDSYNSGCITIAQAIEQLSRQLVEQKLPPIKLIIMMALLVSLEVNNTIPYWGLNAPWYATSSPFKIPDGPPSIDIALLDDKVLPKIVDIIREELVFAFQIEEEPGPWNELFLSTGYTAFRWICFVLVLCVFIYAYARVAMLIKYASIAKNLQLVAFIFGSLSCIYFH